MQILQSDTYSSPIGDILLIAEDKKLCYLDFIENNIRLDRLLTIRYGSYEINQQSNILDMNDRLNRYFDRDWSAFDGLQLETHGTDFQRLVWTELAGISVGRTMSYQELASSIGNPGAIRAAASSNARNPVAIIIPCHRVIGKDGTLTGYAGGLDRKRWLLEHEGVAVK